MKQFFEVILLLIFTWFIGYGVIWLIAHIGLIYSILILTFLMFTILLHTLE